MSSILTNASAMTALQTLQSTNKGLETTQSRIATGQRVSTASDNAAYWSIATTMRSDNNAMSTVRDALGLGAAQVDVAYTAMDAVKETLDTMKTKLVAASQPDVDKGKTQAEIKQLQSDLKTYSEAASFSGGNWLSVSETSNQKIVASFTRDSSGGISLGTIDIDTSKTALFNSDADATGLLEQGSDLDAAALGGLAVAAEAAGDDTDAATLDVFSHDFTTDGSMVLEEGNSMRFDMIVNGETTKVTIDRAMVDSVLGTSDGEIADADALASIVTKALDDAGLTGKVSAAANAGGDGVSLTNEVGITAEDTLEVANVESSSNGNYFDATDFDISSATEDQLGEYLAGIDSMLSAVTTAASDLGAVKTRVDSQQTFVKSIMDAVDRGVGQLVDADMNEESTRLQALQVQQQLGIQALSIANGSAQQILSLFR